MSFETGTSYNPDKLMHVKGQEGPIQNIDKAAVMAALEDEYREMAKMYQAYCTQGSAFENYPIMPVQVAEFKRLKEAEGAGRPFDTARMQALLQDQEVRAYDLGPELYEHDHPVSPAMYEDFMEWREKGVPAEYVRRIGEQFAEQSGAVFDYATSMDYKSEAELKKDIAKNVVPALFHAVLTAIQRNWTTESDVAQNAGYHNAIGKVAVNATVIFSALDRLKKRKHLELEEGVT